MSASATVHVPDGPLARLREWWTILRICLEERLVYRGDFILGTLMRFLPVITQILLWSAVFAANQSAQDGAAAGKPVAIAGYLYGDFIAYYLLTMITRAFSSMPGLASMIARSIRDGTIKKYLIQPVDMTGFLLLSRVAHKLVYYLVAAIPFAVVFYLCRGYFINGWPDAVTMLAFIASLIMSFLIGFFLDATIGMIGFWFLEISSLMFIYMLMSFFLSGQMFPLDMLNRFTVVGSITWGDVVQATPIQYLAYFPAAVFLGKIHGTRLAWGLVVQLGWLLFFVWLCRTAFRRGVRRYSAFGG